jgi:hypothetical protein
MAEYPSTFMPYRHMEVDGVPHGYDRWKRYCVIRHPLERLWSVYKKTRDFPYREEYETSYTDRMRLSTLGHTFDSWLQQNNVLFTNPYVSGTRKGFNPYYLVNHCIPENRKSQHWYARPDLGTEIVEFEFLADFAESICVDLEHHNASAPDPMEPIDGNTRKIVRAYMPWDFEHYGEEA